MLVCHPQNSRQIGISHIHIITGPMRILARITLKKIILPYLRVKRQELDLALDHCVLCIFDNFKGQLTADVLQLLEENHVNIVFVPPNCTDRLPPLDLSVNKLAKDFLRDKFQQWYSDEIFDQLCKNDTKEASLEPIKFPLQVMKPLGAQWINHNRATRTHACQARNNLKWFPSY